MTSKVYTVTDLGPGDGGKGGVVHKIATMTLAHTIIKVGGAQGSHGVCTSAGEQFAFSQWGCGTLEGIKTHISSRFILAPSALLNEENALRYQCGIHNAFDLLTIDESVLCATPLHGIASRLKEMALGDNPRGTIGTGVGEAYRYQQRFPDLSIRARDLSRPDLKDLLFAIREQIRRDLDPVIKGEFLPIDRENADKEIMLLNDDGFIAYIAQRFQEVSQRATIVNDNFLGQEILSKDGIVVVESSHGILTDHFHGFYPHVSAIQTLPCFTHAILNEAGYNQQIINIAVSRTYAIRHGAGPMPTANPEMSKYLLPGSHKEENRYQGKVRVGPLDLVLLRYAIEVCGGPSAFDGLAITWFDQIQKNGGWHMCHRYNETNNRTYFAPTGAIHVRHESDEQQLEHQKNLGKQLLNCTTEITTHELPTHEDTFSFCKAVLDDQLAVPVRMVSFGPTEREKVCK